MEELTADRSAKLLHGVMRKNCKPIVAELFRGIVREGTVDRCETALGHNTCNQGKEHSLDLLGRVRYVLCRLVFPMTNVTNLLCLFVAEFGALLREVEMEKCTGETPVSRLM